jgi:hypothetical protein
MEEYISSLPPYNYKYEWDPQEAAKILVSCARRRWRGCDHIDDITCCIVKLKGKDCFFAVNE